MKNVGIIVLLVLVTAGAWFFMSNTSDETSGKTTQAAASGASTGSGSSIDLGGSRTGSGSVDMGGDDEEWIDDSDEPIQPATELYQSSEEALAVVKKGADEYDDLLLEQFVGLGPECTWCPEFYTEVKGLMIAAEQDSDQKSYYAELLAVSGRPENVATIIDELTKADPNNPDFDLYADALEMTTGGEDVVKELEKNLTVENDEVRESIVAAISNQGSAAAIDVLYRHAVDKGIGDEYYEVGVGLGEVIPDKEAFPLMRKIAEKRDAQSHLAVKGLLNAGMEGLKVVHQMLENSSDPESDKKLLQDAVDHVTFDEENERYLREEILKSQNPALVELGKESIKMLEEEAE